jgi:hypothetical protein
MERIADELGQPLLCRTPILELAAAIPGDDSEKSIGIDPRFELLPDSRLLTIIERGGPLKVPQHLDAGR